MEVAEPEVASIPAARIVKAFLKMRDRRAELKAEFERQDAAIKEQQVRLEGELMKILNEAGGDSLGTEFGTIYRSVDVKASCQDWDALYQFIRENDMFELLEKRVGKNAIKEYMDKHEGRLPPGVSIFKEATVTIRRK
jgi:hypothetical protein